MFTIKQIEDRIRARLLDGTGRASNGAFCAYRDPDGRACAVGCLIDDRHYSPDFEGFGLNDSQELADPTNRNRIQQLYRALRLSGVPTDEYTLSVLIEWQSRHDNPLHWNGLNYTGPIDSVV